MIHAYNDVYLYDMMENLASLFDIAINYEKIEADQLSIMFAESKIAIGIENANPKILNGMSGIEMLTNLLDKDIVPVEFSIERTPEFWAGWIMAYAQWYLNKSFKEIFEVFPLSKLISMYYPFHEANEMKTIEVIERSIKQTSTLKKLRIRSKITQEELSILSGVNLRSIKAYEQGENNILKAQSEILYKLAKALNCKMEDLLK